MKPSKHFLISLAAIAVISEAMSDDAIRDATGAVEAGHRRTWKGQILIAGGL